MYNIRSVFIPGDVPGDPELGGWRPLPKSFFKKPAFLAIVSYAVSLEQAIQLIAFSVRYLCLSRALNALAIGLSKNKSNFIKGGGRCS